MNRKVNALKYVKAERNNTLESYKAIDVEELREVFCNDDWYVIGYTNGDIETFNNLSDERANSEINFIYLKNGKTLKR